MAARENFIAANILAYNEPLRRPKYTTKIHVLEKPSKQFDFHIEGSNMSKTATPKPMDVKDKNTEIMEALTASREVEKRSSHTDLSKLYKSSRKPHSILTASDLKEIQRTDNNHDEVMSTQIKKMKQGLERLQEITQKFSCAVPYREDIEYLKKNINQALNRTDTSSTVL